jgi:hypothetical protein
MYIVAHPFSIKKRIAHFKNEKQYGKRLLFIFELPNGSRAELNRACLTYQAQWPDPKSAGDATGDEK